MAHAKNYETVSTFVEVMQKKLWPLFFPDTVYNGNATSQENLYNIHCSAQTFYHL